MSLPHVNRRKKEPKPKTTTSQKEIEEKCPEFCHRQTPAGPPQPIFRF